MTQRCEYCARPVGYRTSCEGCGAGVALRVSESPILTLVNRGLISIKCAMQELGFSEPLELPSFHGHGFVKTT